MLYQKSYQNEISTEVLKMSLYYFFKIDLIYLLVKIQMAKKANDIIKFGVFSVNFKFLLLCADYTIFNTTLIKLLYSFQL